MAAGVVEIHRAGSADAADRFPDGAFDWVYVDGDHTYESVRIDLELYRAKVRPGGILAGDDYGTEGWWQAGVTRSVNELVATGVVEPIRLGTHFVLRVPEAPT
jgi:predicted O-methyltransferase YrrM